MKDIAKNAVAALGYDQGAHAIPGIKFRHAARELGVTTWGMNVLEIEAECRAVERRAGRTLRPRSRRVGGRVAQAPRR
jgi:hypothetical protein